MTDKPRNSSVSVSPAHPPAIAQDRNAQMEAALSRIREKIQTCIQCGTCTASCPNAGAMDMTPRRLWRLVILGETRQVFESRTFALCSACYCCTLRCPRGLLLTDAMADLKQAAALQKPDADPGGIVFYRLFVRSVRRYGRVQETRLMAGYFAAMALRKPLLSVTYVPLGLRMLRQKKLHLGRPGGRRSLEKIFRKIETMEDGP